MSAVACAPIPVEGRRSPGWKRGCVILRELKTVLPSSLMVMKCSHKSNPVMALRHKWLEDVLFILSFWNNRRDDSKIDELLAGR